MSAIASINKKQIVAISGVFLVGFLFAHLSGNLLVFKGPDALNNYAHFLHSLGPVLWIMRIGLVAAFLTHMGMGLAVTIQNRSARGTKYLVYKDHTDKKSFAAKTMPITGMIILLYLIIHLMDFTYNTFARSSILDGLDAGLYGIVVNSFSNPIHALGYVIAMFAMGLHLSHAIQSVCQTFGFNRHLDIISKISLGIGIGLAVLYSSIPVYVLAVL
jgi:succinate dehydrogenase / fumarate reductase cytochrome b subunit